MAVRINKKLAIKKFLPTWKKQFNKRIRQEIADAIVEEILSGISPVDGKRFEEYSDSYEKIKGRREPVDMLVSGKMLESIQVNETKDAITIFFTRRVKSFNLANIHNNGKGRVPERRLLPDRKGEEFSPSITKMIREKVDEALKVALKKVNS